MTSRGLFKKKQKKKNSCNGIFQAAGNEMISLQAGIWEVNILHAKINETEILKSAFTVNQE